MKATAKQLKYARYLVAEAYPFAEIGIERRERLNALLDSGKLDTRQCSGIIRILKETQEALACPAMPATIDWLNELDEREDALLQELETALQI